MRARDAGTFMRAFGDGTRLRIVAALGGTPLTVAELTRLLRCPEQRVSRHLRYLHARGVVESEAALNSVVYSLAKPQNGLHRLVVSALQNGLAGVEEVQRDSDRLARGRHRLPDGPARK